MPTVPDGQIKVGHRQVFRLFCTEPGFLDLDPVPVEQRTWGGIDYWAYWVSDSCTQSIDVAHRRLQVSDMLAPPLASTVSSVMSLGFTARETIPIVFFGFAICSVVITLTGKVSYDHTFIVIKDLCR